MERQRRSFTEEYKRQAVQLALSGRSIGSVTKELGLRDSVLRRWVDKLRQEPTSAAWRPTTQATPMSADQRFGDRPPAPGERTAAHGARHFKKVDRDLRRNPDMSFCFIEDHRDTYPVRLMCAVLEVSPAGYYGWRDRPVSEPTKSNASLLAAVGKSIKTAARVTAVLASMPVLRKQGRGAGRGRIERLTNRHGIHAHHGAATPGAHH